MHTRNYRFRTGHNRVYGRKPEHPVFLHSVCRNVFFPFCLNSPFFHSAANEMTAILQKTVDDFTLSFSAKLSVMPSPWYYRTGHGILNRGIFLPAYMAALLAQLKKQPACRINDRVTYKGGFYETFNEST